MMRIMRLGKQMVLNWERLTDDEGGDLESKISIPRSSVSSVTNLADSNVKIGDSDLLPSALIHSLYNERKKKEEAMFKKELSQVSSSTIKELDKKLSDLNHLQTSDFHFDKSIFSESPGNSRIIQNQSISIISQENTSSIFFQDVEIPPNEFPFEMKISKKNILKNFHKKRNKTASSFVRGANKEVNLNINLNLRLLKGEKSMNFKKKKKHQNSLTKKLSQKKSSISKKAYNNPKNVFYKSRKSYNKFLGELSKALVKDKDKDKQREGSRSKKSNQKEYLHATKKKMGMKRTGKNILSMIKKKNTNIKKKLKEKSDSQRKDIMKRAKKNYKNSQDKKITSIRIEGFYEILDKETQSNYKSGRKMSQRTKKRSKLRSFRPKLSQQTDRSISNLLNLTRTKRIKTARDQSQKSIRRERLNSSLKRRRLNSKKKLKITARCLLKKPQSVNKLKMNDINEAIKKKKFSLQQQKIINKELAAKFAKTYNSSNFKTMNKKRTKKKSVKNAQRRSDPFMSMKGIKTARSHYSKDKKAPLKILAQKLGVNLKGLKRFDKKADSRLFSEQIKKSISTSKIKNFKAALSFKESSSIRMKRPAKDKTKSNLIRGSKFNLLMNKEMNNSKVYTSREKCDKSGSNKAKSKTSRGGVRNRTMGYLGPKTMSGSRKSMNSVYEKNYVKRFQRIRGKKGSEHLHSRSEIRPVIGAGNDKAGKNRQSTLSSTRLSNAFQKSMKA